MKNILALDVRRLHLGVEQVMFFVPYLNVPHITTMGECFFSLLLMNIQYVYHVGKLKCFQEIVNAQVSFRRGTTAKKRMED